jgi:hypothetical protein
LALANGSRLALETVVVTDYLHDPWVPFLPFGPGTATTWLDRARRKLSKWLLCGLQQLTPYASLVPQMTLLPDARDLGNCDTWWALSPAIVRRFLALVGFEESQAYTHRQWYDGRAAKMFTVVARRTQPISGH